MLFCYVMNRRGQVLVDDPREFALRVKMYEAVQACRDSEGCQKERLPLEKLSVPQNITRRYVEEFPYLKPLP